MALTLQQSLRRIGQLSSGWRAAFSEQDSQLVLAKKLYAANGMNLVLTSSGCPEQYDVFKDGQQVAYYRLRGGEFRVDYPSACQEEIYTAEPNGDGMFDADERLPYLTKALRVVQARMNAA